MSEIVMTQQNSPGAIGANMVAFFFTLSGRPAYVGNDNIVHELVDDPGTLGNLAVTNNLSAANVSANTLAVTTNQTIAGNMTANVTGNVTMNTLRGRVRVQAGNTVLVVTNSLVSATSSVQAWPSQQDATGLVRSVTPAAGNFTIALSAPTANMNVDFVVASA